MPHEIDDTLFENWIETFASRIGRELSAHAVVALHVALCKVFDSDDDFHAAAQHVYEHWASWSAWPAPVEFESARATLRRIPDAEIKATEARYLAPARQLAAPRVSAALEQFGEDWRAELRRAHADPESVAAARRNPLGARDGTDPWMTDERQAAADAPDIAAA